MFFLPNSRLAFENWDLEKFRGALQKWRAQHEAIDNLFEKQCLSQKSVISISQAEVPVFKLNSALERAQYQRAKKGPTRE